MFSGSEVLKRAYLLDAQTKTYIPYMGFFTDWKDFTAEEKAKFDDFSKKLGSQSPDIIPNFFFSGFWVYSTKDVKVVQVMKTKNIFEMANKETDGVTLYKGWNFFSITPDLVGKKFSSITGDCELLKVALWTSDRQNWAVFDMNIKEQYDYINEIRGHPL